jgi:hypothetical protein
MTQYAEAEDILHGLAAVLAEPTRFASPEILEERVLGALSRLTPSEAESFASALGDVGHFFKSSEVRGVAGTALPILGTAVGTVYGGPVGAAIGGSLGGAAGQAIAGKPPTSSTRPPPQSAAPVGVDAPVAAPPGPVPGIGPAPGAATPAQTPQAGSAAAAQLLSVIQNPALLASLLALVMGSSGKTSVPVGSGTEVPVGAMMNLVGVLANRAAEDAEEILADRQDGTPAYLFDESGSLTCDPAISSHRADALLRVLSAQVAVNLDESAPCRCAECEESWDVDSWW